jgi:hypothetical protein
MRTRRGVVSGPGQRDRRLDNRWIQSAASTAEVHETGVDRDTVGCKGRTHASEHVDRREYSGTRPRRIQALCVVLNSRNVSVPCHRGSAVTGSQRRRDDEALKEGEFVVRARESSTHAVEYGIALG